MRLLVLAAVALVGVAAAASAEEEKPGFDRWPVKTSAPLPGDSAVVAVADLVAKPDAPDVSHNDARYQAERLPGEGLAVTTTGWLRLVARETDGDFHMQLTTDPTGKGPCFIVETPDPQYVADPVLKAQVFAVRSWVLVHALGGKSPAAAGTMLKQPVKVTVTGALFFDDSHVQDVPRGKKGMKAGSLWELHPVTGIAPAQ